MTFGIALLILWGKEFREMLQRIRDEGLGSKN